MRKLASIEFIEEIKPLENSDFLAVAKIKNWQVVIRKEEFKVKDIIVYFEIDSFLPVKPEFEFLRKSSYKKLDDGTEGFRLKTVKLRGQISQGLILGLDILPQDDYEIGQDVTQILGITKYEPPIPTQLAGEIVGVFPDFIPKTEEPRLQNLDYDAIKEDYLDKNLVVTEKLDGTSFTAFYLNGSFGVCSRNYQLKETSKNAYWRITRQLDIENKLIQYCQTNSLDGIAIQGELIGEGIQKNKYQIKGLGLYVFNVLLNKNNYFQQANYATQLEIIQQLNLNSVPEVLNGKNLLPNSVETLLSKADGHSFLNSKTKREGIVVRDLSQRLSFKVISNEFLLKEK